MPLLQPKNMPTIMESNLLMDIDVKSEGVGIASFLVHQPLQHREGKPGNGPCYGLCHLYIQHLRVADITKLTLMVQLSEGPLKTGFLLPVGVSLESHMERKRFYLFVLHCFILDHRPWKALMEWFQPSLTCT